MNSWAPLWSGLVDSSIWEEPDHVFRVFMAMMSLKDPAHIVSMDGYRLAKRIHMPVEKVEDALRILSSPDRIRPGQADEGRRIRKVADGWEIINGEYYRKMVSEEMRRSRNRRAQMNHRERKKAKPTQIPPEEKEYLEAEKRGASDKELDEIVTRSLPEKLREEPTSYRIDSVPATPEQVKQVAVAQAVVETVQSQMGQTLSNPHVHDEDGEFINGHWVARTPT